MKWNLQMTHVRCGKRYPAFCPWAQRKKLWNECECVNKQLAYDSLGFLINVCVWLSLICYSWVKWQQLFVEPGGGTEAKNRVWMEESESRWDGVKECRKKHTFIHHSHCVHDTQTHTNTNTAIALILERPHGGQKAQQTFSQCFSTQSPTSSPSTMSAATHSQGVPHTAH